MSDQSPPATPSPAPGDPDASAIPTGDPTAPVPGGGGTVGGWPQPSGAAWDPANSQSQPQPSGAAWDPANRQSQPQPFGAAWDPANPQSQGWAVPPTGGVPVGSGPYHPQPWYPGAPVAYPGQPAYGWYPPGYGFDPGDPLVTPPGAGLSGWFDRCVGVVRRGWRLLLPILLLSQVLPAAVMSVLSLAVDPSAEWDAAAAEDPNALPDGFLTDLATVLGLLIGGTLLFGLLQCLGWAAGTWVVARQAAGEPVSLGAALGYGLRRALGLWGWFLLVSLIISLGLCFCVLPGIYFAFLLSLTGPVYLFERRPPIDRSYRMVKDRLGLVLGRVALVGAAVIVGTGAASMVEAAGSLPFGATPLDSAGTAVGIVGVIVLAGVVALPAHLAQLVGLVVTYAEQRAHEGPVNSGRLAGELG